jgi:outer membrane receptor protein involved in Fe transport
MKYILQKSDSSYAYSNAPTGRVDGKRIAYMPRNTLALGVTWAEGRRSLLSARAVYRSERFEDMSNLTLWPASWSVDVLATWETSDKHWSIGAAALNLGGHKSPRQYERYVLDVRYRF